MRLLGPAGELVGIADARLRRRRTAPAASFASGRRPEVGFKVILRSNPQTYGGVERRHAAFWAVRGGSYVALTKDRKTEIIGSYKTHDSDTGSPEVQVAHPQRAHQLPHRALQDPREGPPLAPRPAEAGRPAPPPARLPEEQGHRPLRRTHQAPRHPQVAARPAGRDGPAMDSSGIQHCTRRGQSCAYARHSPGT